MIVPELMQLQQALSRKADQIQHEFTALSDELAVVARRLVEARGEAEAEAAIVSEQTALGERQRALAAEVNVWRDRARAVQRQPGEAALRAYLDELAEAGDVTVRAAVEAVRFALEHPEAAEERRQAAQRPATPAGRLLQRARSEFDLRGSDPGPRQRAAVEFTNRPGMGQSDEALRELEAALADPDPHAQDVALLTVIQLHRFRALRLGDLDAAHASVRRLAKLKHAAVVPALIEVVETARTGFTAGAGGEAAAGDNLRSRLVALGALVEWRSAHVQNVVRQRVHDRDPRMAEAAARALEVFPGAWG